MSFEVRSPDGRWAFARWCCAGCDQDTGPRVTIGEPGLADRLREEAAQHVRDTGHEVDYWRGTTETLIPLATETPR